MATPSEFSSPATAVPSEATLELTFISIDRHHFSHSFVPKRKPPSVSAWVDPAHKRSTTSRNCVLNLPLSLPHLQNPDSVLTVQIISPRSAFKPFVHASSGSVPLSSICLSGEPVTVHLRRPSGRVAASVRFLARILWSLNSYPVLVDDFSIFEAEAGLSSEPSAPPLPEPETRPGEKLNGDSSAWGSFMLGALSGAVAVILVNFMRRH